MPLPRPAVAAGGVGAVLLAVTLGVTFLPDLGDGPAAPAAAAADAGSTPSAASLAAQLRIEERTSRDRARTSVSPSPSASPSATPKPTPKPLPKVVGRLWAETAVNIRSRPTPDSDRIGTLEAVTRIGVTGVTEDGWTQVVTGKKVGWIKSSYLSKSKPKPKPSTPTGVSGKPCPISSSIESGLTSNARAVYRAVCAEFGNTVSSFGGLRPGDDGDHGSGRAVDIMVSGDPGWDIARYVQAHAGQLGVTYVIYQQKIWMAGNPTSQWKLMEDRGSTTANHYDHVHVSVS